MTFGKLKELLDCMTESQLKKEVTALFHDNDDVVLHVKDIRILLNEDSGERYPALVA